jgi:hypothetical protein
MCHCARKGLFPKSNLNSVDLVASLSEGDEGREVLFGGVVFQMRGPLQQLCKMETT